MRWIPDKNGAFPRRLYFETMSELDAECERLVKMLYFRRRGSIFEPPLDDDSLQVLIEQSADIDLNADLPSNVEGVTEFRAGQRPIVRMNRDVASVSGRRHRMRTGLAHEWFHAVYHRPAWEARWAQARGKGASTSIGSCSRDGMVGASDDNWLEFQAGYASCAILMPISWLEKELPDAGGPALNERALVARVAARFDVSEDAARWRLRQLGILAEMRAARQLSLV